MNIERSKLTLLVMTLVLSTQTVAGESIDEVRNMAADGLVSVENLAGSIEVEVWGREEVEIRAELGDSVEKFEITESSNGIRIRVENRSQSRNMDGTDIRMRVPSGASLELEGVSADVDVTGSEGKLVQINTVSGDIVIEASPEQVDIHSVSGDVEYSGKSSRSAFETVSGEITVQGGTGEIQVSTVSGDVSLAAGAFDRARFEAVSGDLNLELSVRDGGRLTSDSMSGDLVLRLPSDQQARFSAQTFSGKIRSDFGKTEQVSHGPGSRLEHVGGSNGASIRLESFSGDIQIRQE